EPLRQSGVHCIGNLMLRGINQNHVERLFVLSRNREFGPHVVLNGVNLSKRTVVFCADPQNRRSMPRHYSKRRSLPKGSGTQVVATCDFRGEWTMSTDAVCWMEAAKDATTPSE